MSSAMSSINRTCKLIFEKNKNFGLIKARNVSIHREIQKKESNITDLKFLKLFNIQSTFNLYKYNIV